MLASAPARQNLLVLADPAHTSLPQQVLHQALLQEALSDEAVHVVTHAPLPVALERACALRQKGALHAARARRLLQALRPDEAAVSAAMASQKWMRVATLTGDVGPLSESLALQAAAYLHAGTVQAASRVLLQLLVLQPGWRPDPSLYNPAMQRVVGQVRARLPGLPRRTLQVDPGAADTALYVNGVLLGLGKARLEVVANQPHYLYALPATGEPVGDRLVPAVADATYDPDDDDRAAPPALTVELAPLPPSPHPSSFARYQSVFAASSSREGFVEPSLPALAAAGVQDIWVLSLRGSTATLVRFDLQTGRRHASQTHFDGAHLAGAQTAAQILLQAQAQAALQAANASAARAEAWATQKKTVAALNKDGDRFWVEPTTGS